VKTSAGAILLAVLAMIAACAAILCHIEKTRHLGAPALVMTRGEVRDEDGHLVSTNTVALPEGILNFDSQPMPVTRVELDMLPRDTVFARRLYQAEDGFSLMLSVVMMGTDRSSIHRPRWCLDGQGYRIVESVNLAIALEGERRIRLPVRRLIAEKEVLQPDGSKRMERAIYLYWYVAKGYVTSNDSDRMWWLAKELVTKGTLQRWAYVAVLGVCHPGEEEQTYERLCKVISASTPRYHIFGTDTVFALPE